MKLEFGDFYKFIVSLGVVLVGLAFFIPWLFLSQPFDLLIDADKLKGLTSSAQSTVLHRQAIVKWFLDIIPTFAWSSAIVGTIVFVFGAVFWWRKSQKFTDQFNEINLELLRRQLKPATAEEVKEKASETEMEEKEPIENVQQKLVEGLRFDVFAFQQTFEQKLVRCFEHTHEVLANQRLGSLMFDFVLLAKTSDQPDYVVEVKHLRFGFKFGWLRDNAVKQLFAGALYEKDSNRNVTPVLLVVAPKAVLDKTPIEHYLERIKKDILIRHSHVTVSCLASEDLDSLNCGRVRRLIS